MSEKIMCTACKWPGKQSNAYMSDGVVWNRDSYSHVCKHPRHRKETFNPINGVEWYLPTVYVKEKNAKGDCVDFEKKPPRPPTRKELRQMKRKEKRV